MRFAGSVLLHGESVPTWTYTDGVVELTAPSFTVLMAMMRAVFAAREKEATRMEFNWWNVRLDMLPRETSASPADLAEDALAALEDSAMVPYLRGAAVAVIDGTLDVRCDVVARSVGSALNIVEQTVNHAVGARTYKGGARKVR